MDYSLSVWSAAHRGGLRPFGVDYGPSGWTSYGPTGLTTALRDALRPFGMGHDSSVWTTALGYGL